jgi:hypothetical protein
VLDVRGEQQVGVLVDGPVRRQGEPALARWRLGRSSEAA